MKALRMLPEVAADRSEASVNHLARQLGFFQAQLGFVGLGGDA